VKNIKNRRFVEWGTLEEFYSNVKAEKHEGLGQLVDDCVLVNVKMPNDMRVCSGHECEANALTMSSLLPA
jgi:hypothetical protein